MALKSSRLRRVRRFGESRSNYLIAPVSERNGKPADSSGKSINYLY